jgi:formylglycine-generating enzyme required for sulfatase activity
MYFIKRRYFLKWLALVGISSSGIMSCNLADNYSQHLIGNELKLKNFDFETVNVNRAGEIFERKTVQAQFFGEPISNELFIDMVLIPGGSIIMGSPENEILRKNNESPLHSVTISKFFMSKHAVDQQKWKIIATLPKINIDLSASPSKFRGSELPVENVSWLEANEFCARLSHLSGRNYRLPTEAEWEYACRAQTSTPFPFGATITSALANFNGEQPYASEPKGEFFNRTVDVGEFTANAFGLYQMNGNIWEWCLDSWHDSYRDAPIDGRAWLTENNVSSAVLRGGSWGSSGERCRSAARFQAPHQYRGGDVGFRVVCTT